MEYSNLDKWKKAAEKYGYKISCVTRAKHCTYWRAINKGIVVGFFNDFKDKTPFGTLLEPSDSI